MSVSLQFQINLLSKMKYICFFCGFVDLTLLSVFQARLISLYFDTKRYQEALALGKCWRDTSGYSHRHTHKIVNFNSYFKYFL